MEAAYRVLAEQAPELVARHALDSTFKYLSRASLGLLGRAPSELLGQRALDCIAPEDKQRVRGALTGLFDGSYPKVRYSARYQHQSGDWVWLDVTAYPVLDEHDQSIREYVTVAQDARPERARMNETRALEEQVARLTALLAAAPGAMQVPTHLDDGLQTERERQLQLRFEASRTRPAAPQQVVAPVPARPGPPAAPTERKKPLGGIVLLVVEDNEINQILARDLLEAAGATVVLASDGQQALALAAERTPGFDTILMDVQMPGMDGHTTTRRMREEAKTARTPIIAMTAHAFDAERTKCLASGMNAHVSKPINPRELIQTVLQWARPDSVPVEKSSKPARPAPDRHAASSAHEPDLDVSALAVVFKDPARQLDFLRKFVAAAQRTLGEVDDAWRARDHQTLGFLGHKLKSSAKACGAHALAATLAELERESKPPSWPALEALRTRAHVLLAEVVKEVAVREAAAAARPSTPRS